MPAARKKNLGFGWLTRKRETYHRDVAKERRELQREAMAERRRRLSLKKIEAAERAAAAKIAASDRKIAAAQAKIEAAARKGGKGGMSESQFEQTRARLQKEIEKQEKDKSLATALFDEVREYGKGRNPSWGYGIYQGTGFSTKQLAHFRSRVAAETYARSLGLKGYSIKRAFAKDRNPCGNPDRTEPDRNYRGATIEHLGDMKGYRVTIPARISRDRRAVTVEVYALPQAKERIDAEFGPRRNPSESSKQTSTEYRLGYSLGQTDRETAALPKTWAELEATFGAKFDPARANALWFFEAYKAGYDPTGGTTESNPRRHSSRGSSRSNPEGEGDGSEEYQQAKRIAELFHGRPVKEEITITDQIDTPDWYAEIGPLVELRIKGFRGYPFRTAKFCFGLSEDQLIHLLTSPDGRQMYLRGGDQEIALDALGMGSDSDWFRDQMAIGEVTYFAYRDGKKFHGFKMTEYTHKVGSALDWTGTKHIQKTNAKPVMIYDTRSKKISLAGGQGKVETETLVEDMSPGIVN
jgi:hypothetical protein